MPVNSKWFIGSHFTAIIAEGLHFLALTSDGSIVGWSNNGLGQATPTPAFIWQ